MPDLLDTPPTPGQVPDPPLLEKLWRGLTSPDVHAKLRSGEYTSRDLDDAVQYHTNGRLSSFKQLAQIRIAAQTRLGSDGFTGAQLGTSGLGSKGPGPGVAEPLPVGRGATAASEISNALALGLPEKLAPYGRGGPQAFKNILEAGRRDYPLTAAGSEAVGSAVPALFTGGATEQVAAPLISKLPISAIGRMMARGATAGAAGAGSAAYGAQPNLPPDWRQILPAAGIGAATGGAMALPAWWAASKLAPMEHLASRSVMQSAPGETPSMPAGVKALREGTTGEQVIAERPSVVRFQPLSQEANQQLPEPLRQVVGELSPQLRVEAGKYLVKSPKAINDIRVASLNKLERIRDGTRAIEKAYNPMLESRALSDNDISGLPLESQRTMNALQNPTARDLMDRLVMLRKQSSAIFDARDVGGDVADKLPLAHRLSDEADHLRDWLGNNVDGFNDLQAKTAPWLQREAEFRIARKQIVGRAIKALGEAIKEPKGPVSEAAKELEGYSAQQISDRAARRFGKILMSDDVNDLFRAANEPELREIIPSLLRSRGILYGVGGYQASRHSELGPAVGAQLLSKLRSLIRPTQ